MPQSPRPLSRIALLLAALAAAPAGAATCVPRADVLAALTDRFGEHRTGIGLTSRGNVMEVFSSPETGTWTVTVTRPDGTTCILSSGEGFEALSEAPPPGEPV